MKASLSGAVFTQVFLNKCRYLNGYPEEENNAVLSDNLFVNTADYMFIGPFSAKTR